MTARLCLFALLATAVAAAQAQPVYKCVNEGGKVTYSQNPCYGENWHRLGEKRAERKPAAAPAPSAAPGTSATQATSATAAAPAAAAKGTTASTQTAGASAPATSVAAPAAAAAAPAAARP